MKIFTAGLMAESCMLCPKICEIDTTDVYFGEKALDALCCREVFEEAGAELIPSVYFDGYAQGYISIDVYRYVESKVLKALRAHLSEIDGIFLFLHGASHFEELPGGSGEHELLRRIREITGPYIPIAVAMDPHGNVSPEMCSLANVIRCYRESPHTDAAETKKIVARMLLSLLAERREVHPVYTRVPILVGGERCVSYEGPLLEINRMLDEIEKDPRIMSISYHVGFAWADSYLCSAAVVAVPSAPEHAAYAEEKTREIADWAVAHREEFVFTGRALPPEEALEEILALGRSRSQAGPGQDALPLFISDSGDNITAGALGSSTFVLRQLIEARAEVFASGARVLVCAVYDPGALRALSAGMDGGRVTVGCGIDADAEPVSFPAQVVAEGDVAISSWMGTGSGKAGNCVTLRVRPEGLPGSGRIDVTVADCSYAYVSVDQFAPAGIDWRDYDVIVVKEGYLFPDLKEHADSFFMSLTPGATYLLTEKIPYRFIQRPMWPVDRL